MEEHFKLFGNDIDFRIMVIFLTEYYMRVKGMENILEAFNRALYVSYCRCIADCKFGYDVLNDDFVP